MQNKNIDGGKPFDRGRTSADYAKFRDIYPTEFYNKIIGQGLCTKGQRALDIGTGTGVINSVQNGQALTYQRSRQSRRKGFRREWISITMPCLPRISHFWIIHSM